MAIRMSDGTGSLEDGDDIEVGIGVAGPYSYLQEVPIRPE